MGKPDWCPQEVWDNAEITLKFVPADDEDAVIASISRALLDAKREAYEDAAQIGEARKPLYLAAGERLAISEVVSSIRGEAKRLI